jgi:hypothetical protein
LSVSLPGSPLFLKAVIWKISGNFCLGYSILYGNFRDERLRLTRVTSHSMKDH